jgi:restriction system protein
METLENAFQRIKESLADDLLKEVKNATPAFFEKTVLKLLRKMGYGDLVDGSMEHTGKSGDECVDGKIKEDKLGLDVIYVQAKKWENTVSRPEIQKFVGALKGQNANKGIFITTSDFSGEALEYAKKIDSPKIVLIDGETLAQYMIDHDIGVSKVKNFEIKRKDTDFFVED